MSDSSSPRPELHGLDPGELLARGMQTVRFSGAAHDWTPPTPEEAARLLPQYRIESLLGRGGMGAVYKGFQEKLGRAVAIKLLPAELSTDEQFVTRFEREARTLAKLQHPGIVSVYDFGQTSEGHLFFVMEYVEGTDLRRVLEGPGLEPEQALEIITQICEALHAAHRQGVIHRDIKPANILLTCDGRVKLADFGLARPEQEEREALTMSNAALGTPDYMAPEQREGRSDSRVDIYALGVMLYEMLTGQLPRGAWAPPSRKVQVDVRIDEVVLKALQHEPDLRYQQASEMKTDVESIRSGQAVEAPVPAAKRQSLSAWAWLAIVAGSLLLGFVAIGVLAIGSSIVVPNVARINAGPRPSAEASSTPQKGADASKPPASTDPEAGNSEPGPSLGGAIEDPIPNCPLLRRFRFPDSEAGLSKVVYMPAKPGYGLIVRFRSAVDFIEDFNIEKGFDENAVWEWVQVPPLNGEGENTVTVTFGAPVWQQAGTEIERLASGMTVYEDIFWGDKIPVSFVEFKPLPDRVDVTLARKKAGASRENEVFLRYEIIAVPQEEIKRLYPQMRGPGETTGESWTWILPPVNPAKWVAAAEKAVAKAPDSASKWQNYGRSLFNLGRYSEAEKALQKASDLSPTDDACLASLAVAFYKAGDESKALQHYDAAVKLNENLAEWDDAKGRFQSWEPAEIEALRELYDKWREKHPGAAATN